MFNCFTSRSILIKFSPAAASLNILCLSAFFLNYHFIENNKINQVSNRLEIELFTPDKRLFALRKNDYHMFCEKTLIICE